METEELSQGRIQQINIEDHMKSSYIDYSMSVIVSRALPDVRDGLKPVQRRVLYGMNELNLSSGGQTKKSARIVGEVMGKYHPHGDASIYDTMVRMAQEWSLRYMLVNGQGNFGSIDGYGAAAMRYTEAKLQAISEEVLADLDKDTVDMTGNFDDTLKEPTVLPCKAPLLLLNGTSGIAVGMATNMAPHNLNEVCDAIIAYTKNEDITIQELMQYVKGPDFPTGGIILGLQGIRDAFETGRGRLVVRARTNIEVSDSGRESIVVTEIPYMVNKRELIEKIAQLVEDKRVEGISEINDESDREGMRIVIRLKNGAVSDVVRNTLFKNSPLQSSFSVNNIALVDGRPRLLNFKQLVKYFVKHRHEVIVRRTEFDLKKAQARAHILEGLLKALDFIDEVISIIRASRTIEESKQALIARFAFSDVQAQAIVSMRLGQLAGLEREKLAAEYDDLMKLIAHLQDVLASYELQMEIIREELEGLKNRFGDARRTSIEPDEGDFNPEDFYPNEDVVITISHLGYIKRTSLSEYKTQNRGGIGSKGSATRDEDFIEHIYVANMHSTLMLITSKGMYFKIKVYDIPEGAKSSKGRAIQNIIRLESGDSICAYLKLGDMNSDEYVNTHYIVMATRCGVIKKTALSEYRTNRDNGIKAITIAENDELLSAMLTGGDDQILIAASNGKCVRFNENSCRAIGRISMGVRGIELEGNEQTISMVCASPESQLDESNTVLVVSANGYGKKSSLEDYRLTSRGAKGVKAMNVTEKTGNLVALNYVNEKQDLMIINKSGLTIRMAISDIKTAGRATQGVRLINIREGDEIAAICVVDKNEEEPAEVAEQIVEQ